MLPLALDLSEWPVLLVGDGQGGPAWQVGSLVTTTERLDWQD